MRFCSSSRVPESEISSAIAISCNSDFFLGWREPVKDMVAAAALKAAGGCWWWVRKCEGPTSAGVLWLFGPVTNNNKQDASRQPHLDRCPIICVGSLKSFQRYSWDQLEFKVPKLRSSSLVVSPALPFHKALGCPHQCGHHLAIVTDP